MPIVFLTFFDTNNNDLNIHAHVSSPLLGFSHYGMLPDIMVWLASECLHA